MLAESITPNKFSGTNPLGPIDAYSTKIAGYRPAKIGQPLSNFDMEHWYFG